MQKGYPQKLNPNFGKSPFPKVAANPSDYPEI